jgi:hypothetical protein
MVSVFPGEVKVKVELVNRWLFQEPGLFETLEDTVFLPCFTLYIDQGFRNHQR